MAGKLKWFDTPSGSYLVNEQGQAETFYGKTLDVIRFAEGFVPRVNFTPLGAAKPTLEQAKVAVIDAIDKEAESLRNALKSIRPNVTASKPEKRAYTRKPANVTNPESKPDTAKAEQDRIEKVVASAKSEAKQDRLDLENASDAEKKALEAAGVK